MLDDVTIWQGDSRELLARLPDASVDLICTDPPYNLGGYSTGMKTRLALARSVLHDPELLLFDEPTSGLDPESSHAVLQLIREMTLEGRTVVMCTHLLVEAEGLADQIVVLESGTDLLAGSQDELIRRYWPANTVWLDAEDAQQARGHGGHAISSASEWNTGAWAPAASACRGWGWAAATSAASAPRPRSTAWARPRRRRSR